MTRIARAAVGFTLLAVSAYAQTPQASGKDLLRASDSHTVQLASDACPVVRPGDMVSLDWNPDFEYSGMVTGLANVGLRFGRVGGNAVTVQQVRALILRELASGQHFTPVGNGYFHIELSVPQRVSPGEYHLIGASSYALTLPEYRGSALTMNNSPLSARYCFTVVPARSVPVVTASVP